MRHGVGHGDDFLDRATDAIQLSGHFRQHHVLAGKALHQLAQVGIQQPGRRAIGLRFVDLLPCF